jgi:acyl-coenzyme A thioesterase PaaI-like protein
MDVDLDLIAKSMGTAVPYIGHMGIEVTAMDVGEATALLPDRPELHNHVGSQHAGALFGVAETASGAAFVGGFAARMGDVTPLARSAQIAYLKVARGPIEAKAKLGTPVADALAALDADGRVDFSVEVEMTDAEGMTVATATVDWNVRLKSSDS